MLSDAGYVLMALAWIDSKIQAEETEGYGKFMLCGLSTVFWAHCSAAGSEALFKSQSIRTGISLSPIWFDPVAQPMTLLILSFALGFIQVVVGLGVKFYMLWRSGDKLGAVFDIGFWWVLFAGILTVLASSMVSIPRLDTIGIGVAAAGAFGLLLTQGRSSPSIFGKLLGGLGSLYGITGYSGDILSPLWLGLVTGIIERS